MGRFALIQRIAVLLILVGLALIALGIVQDVARHQHDPAYRPHPDAGMTAYC